MKATRAIDVQEIIDKSAVSRAQKKALAMCLAFGIVDGFDALITGFVVPAISRDWDVSVASLTPVTLAAVIGTIFGAVLLAPQADRFGRRRVVFCGAALFGVLTVAAAVAPNMETLVVLRFVAGFGLGAVPATLIAYGAEMAPSRLRGTIVTMIGAGLAAGGFFGGFAAGFLIPAFGWRSLFVVGGIAPLLLLVIATRYLPETAQFSALAGNREAVVNLLRKIDSSVEIKDDAPLALREKQVNRSNLRALFDSGRGQMTVVLWILFLFLFVGTFFIFSWLPSVLTKAGVPETTALLATSACTLGGMIGGVLLGMTVDRVASRFRVLACSYSIGAVAIIVSSFSTAALPALFVALFVTGFGIIGTGVCMNAVGASLYPSSIRTTAVGWFTGWGRVGSVLGPAIGGLLLALGLSSKSIFVFSAAPAVICAICVVLLSIASRKMDSEGGALVVVQRQADDVKFNNPAVRI